AVELAIERRSPVRGTPRRRGQSVGVHATDEAAIPVVLLGVHAVARHDDVAVCRDGEIGDAGDAVLSAVTEGPVERPLGRPTTDAEWSPQGVDDLSVALEDEPAGVVGELVVVGDHHARTERSGPVDGIDAEGRIEVAGGAPCGCRESEPGDAERNSEDPLEHLTPSSRTSWRTEEIRLRVTPMQESRDPQSHAMPISFGRASRDSDRAPRPGQVTCSGGGSDDASGDGAPSRAARG